MEKFLTAFGHEKVTVVPQTKKADQISAARRVIKRCEFSKIECEAGLDGLMAWEFEWNDDNNVFSREPLHNWASHPGDSFAYGAQMMEEAQQEQEKDDASRFVAVAPYAKQTVTLNDMWTLADRENSRTARI
jgi:phage terminase large subunit